MRNAVGRRWARVATRWARVATTILALAAFALLWPAQLGGRLSMLVTVGTSMQPRIDEGDLVFVARNPPYRVGEIVAYRSGELRQVALHRIVAASGGRYTLKGDNNSWLDTSRPTDREVVGKLWLHVPGAGKWLDWLRRPRETALLTGLLGLLATTGIHQARKRMRRRRRTGEPTRGRASPRLPAWRRLVAAGPVRAVWARAAAGAAGVCVLGLVIGLAGLSRPLLRQSTELVPFEHRGTFAYEASGGGPLVDRRGPGEHAPVYFRLASRMPVEFAYELDAARTEDVSGTYRLLAMIGDNRGWRRTMVLRPTAAFTGPAFRTTGAVSLPGLRALIERFETATGLQGGTYELRVRAETTVRGQVDGVTLREQFAPELAFDVDDFAIRPKASQDSDPFRPTEPGSAPRAVLAPTRVRLLGFGATVGILRLLGLALALAGAAGTAAALAARRSAPVESPSQRLALRYGSRIVDVERVEPRPDERLVRMTGMRDLARIADNLDAPILHVRDGGLHRYLVQEGATTYSYELTDTAGSERPAFLASAWPAPLDLPPGLPSAHTTRLPAPALEIDLSAPLPPAPARAGGLPPAPPRRGR